jgi:hypothetical protein
VAYAVIVAGFGGSDGLENGARFNSDGVPVVPSRQTMSLAGMGRSPIQVRNVLDRLWMGRGGLAGRLDATERPSWTRSYPATAGRFNALPLVE